MTDPDPIDVEQPIARRPDRLRNPDIKVSDLTAPYLLRILENWEGVTEDDGSDGGKSLPFTEDNLKRMLRVPNFSGGVATAYAEVRAAQPEQRKGN